MKTNMIFFLIFLTTIFLQQAKAGGTDTNVVWSSFMLPVNDIFNSPDGRFVYVNQYEDSRFSKIDAMTGVVIDSVIGKGLISGFSADWKYIYTHYGTFASIKKLDINTYQAVDSIDNLQDITEPNKTFHTSVNVTDLKLSQDGRIFVAISYGKYMLAILNANNLEIIGKKLSSDISDSLDLVGPISLTSDGKFMVIYENITLFDKSMQKLYPVSKVRVWDMKLLQPIKEIFKGQGDFWDFKCSPDGKYFAINSLGNLHIYNLQDFSVYKQMNISHAINFSNDSKYVAISIGDSIHFYKLSNFSEICYQIVHSTTAICYTPDNEYIYDYNRANLLLSKSKSCTFFTSISDTRSIIDPIFIVNPQTHELLISNLKLEDGNYDYRITNLNGNIISEKSILIINNFAIIYFKELPTGIYFLAIHNISYKFIIGR